MYFKNTVAELLDKEKKLDAFSIVDNGSYGMLVSRLLYESNKDDRFDKVRELVTEMMDNQESLTHGDLALIFDSVLQDNVDGMEGFFFENTDESTDEAPKVSSRAHDFINDLSLFVSTLGFKDAENCEAKVYIAWFNFMKAKYSDVWGTMGIENSVCPIWDTETTPTEFCKHALVDDEHYNLRNLVENISF